MFKVYPKSVKGIEGPRFRHVQILDLVVKEGLYNHDGSNTLCNGREIGVKDGMVTSEDVYVYVCVYA